MTEEEIQDQKDIVFDELKEKGCNKITINFTEETAEGEAIKPEKEIVSHLL